MLRASYGRFSQGVLTGEIGLFHPARDADHDHRVRARDRRLHAARLGRRSHASTCSSIPTRARRAPTSTRSASIAKSAAGWRSASRTCARTARTSSDGPTSPVSIVRRRGRCRTAAACRCSCSTRGHAHVGAPLSADESRRILADLQRPGDGRRKAPGARLAGVRLVHAIRGPPGCSPRAARPPRARRSAPSAPPSHADVRARSQRSHQRARPAAKRSPAHLPRHGQRRRAAHRLRRSPPTCSASAASRGRPRRRSLLPQGDQRVLLEPRGSRRLSSQSLLDLRVSRTFAFGGAGASSCCSTCSTRSTTPPKKGWRRTICSARISAGRSRSSIRAAR